MTEAAGISSPRFQSDTEDAEGAKDAKFKAKLAMFEQSTSAADAAEGRTAEGRKTNRGLTISAGCAKKKEDSEDVAVLRSDKRAATMPAIGMRRGDHLLTEEATQKLVEAQKVLQARRRRGSEAVSSSVIPESALVALWNDSEQISCHVHGIISKTAQAHGDERVWSQMFGAETLPGGDKKPCISCLKGSKGFRDTTPNQDNFSLTYFVNGWALACAFDGHGPFGHYVSTRTVETVPYYLAHSHDFPTDMKKALIEAFERSHKEVVAKSLEEGWDVQASGTTACAAIWKGNEIYTANCGDSRCVVGTESEKKLTYETLDHKPDGKAERQRIEESGGEVRTQTYPDGWVNYRIFVKGEDYPGLCMARTLGDESVKAYGVIATPEIGYTTVDMAKQPFMILASDGVWEFLDSTFVVKAVARKILSEGPENTVKKLQREAKKRWKQEEGDYCDDITSILVQFR